METYVVRTLIKQIRESKKITQLQLAESINVSEKTVSKWETGRGLPDISLIEPLAAALNVSVFELISGKQIQNKNKCGNMLKSKFYVCPICGNVITSIGEGNISCCGNALIPWEADDAGDATVTDINGEYYVKINSPMLKNDYVSFVAYVTCDKVNITKLYPEQCAEAYFTKQGNGYIYYYDIKNGLFKIKV